MDSFADKKERAELEEIAFQKHLLGIRSRARLLTEEERLRDLRDFFIHPIITTRVDCTLEVLLSCSSSFVSEPSARQPSLLSPSLSDEDQRRDEE
ncbi:MAG: hypothetical protein GY861_25825 [bacterium]|nr:hypothetical protein [bacterium]